jgi:PAS domain S-box-containing protein
MPSTLPASPPCEGPAPEQSGPVAEHRREERYAVDQTVLVFRPGMSPAARQAHIRDISTRGMQLLVEEPLPFGPGMIRIRWNSHEVKGRILYQHKYDTVHHRIGVELDGSCESLLIEILASQATELRHTRSLLEHQSAELDRAAGLLDLASDALIVTAPDGTIRYWNRGATQLYGWTVEEAIGCSWSGLIGLPDGAQPIETGPERNAVHRRKDGTSVLVECRAVFHDSPPGHPEIRIAARKRVAALASAAAPGREQMRIFDHAATPGSHSIPAIPTRTVS